MKTISLTPFLCRETARALAHAFIQFLSIFLINLATSDIGYGQVPITSAAPSSGKNMPSSIAGVRATRVSGAPENWTASYVDPVQGSSSIDLVRRTLRSNAQLAATRLDVDRARARLRQAGLRPNPTVEFQQLNGISGSPG